MNIYDISGIAAGGVVAGGGIVGWLMKVYSTLAERAVRSDKIDRVLKAVETNGHTPSKGALGLGENDPNPGLADVVIASWNRIGTLEAKVDRQQEDNKAHWIQAKTAVKKAEKAAKEAKKLAALVAADKNNYKGEHNRWPNS